MADLADSQTIPGQIPIAINSRYTLTVENFSVQRSRSVAVATGFGGNFAKRKGVPQWTISWEMPPLLSGGYEVPLSVLEGTMTISYWVGAQEYTLDGVDLSGETLSVQMQAGNTSTQFSATALNRTP